VTREIIGAGVSVATEKSEETLLRQLLR
jgi:hypothetical protein